MKKRILIACFLLPALLLSGCAPVVESAPEEYNIYASFLPVYALSSLVVKDVPGMNLHLLAQPQDGCMRSYAISDWDAAILSQADAVILNGSGLESFEGALLSYGENGPAVISATSSLLLDSSGVSDHEDSHLNGANPWLFLSVDGAEQMVWAIAANMSALDPKYESTYMTNAESAEKSFDALKIEIQRIMADADKTCPVALAHEGLIYFANEWQMNVVLRLDREPGEYADEESQSEYVRLLSESGAKAVLIEKQAPKPLQMALEAAGFIVVNMDTVTTAAAENGAQAYFDAMLYNAREIAQKLPKQE